MPIEATLITTTEAAEIIGVTPGRVRQYVREERLKPKELGPILVFDKQEVLAFARQPRPTGRPPKNS